MSLCHLLLRSPVRWALLFTLRLREAVDVSRVTQVKVVSLEWSSRLTPRPGPVTMRFPN